MVDPLQIENELLLLLEEQQQQEEDNTLLPQLLDLQDPETKFGQFVQLGLDNLVSYVNKPVVGGNNNNNNNDDIKINELLREWMLEPTSGA